MNKHCNALRLLMVGVVALPLAAGAADVEEPLPEEELLIGEHFERGVAQDPSSRKYMLEFSDPLFLLQTSKHRKIWGRAKVLDGETLIIRGETIHLSGIKAPEISDSCKENILNIQFDAGAYSLKSLKTWAANSKAVVCYVENKQGNPGTCFIWGFPGPMNLARMQVRGGAAWALPLETTPYIRDEGWAEGFALANRDPIEKNLWHTECRRPSN